MNLLGPRGPWQIGLKNGNTWEKSQVGLMIQISLKEVRLSDFDKDSARITDF